MPKTFKEYAFQLETGGFIDVQEDSQFEAKQAALDVRLAAGEAAWAAIGVDPYGNKTPPWRVTTSGKLYFTAEEGNKYAATLRTKFEEF